MKESLQFRLSLWLSLAILGIALIGGALSFFVVFEEANELQDDVLRQTAALFDRRHLPVPQLGDKGRLSDSDAEARVVVALLPTAGTTTAGTQTQELGFPGRTPGGHTNASTR